MMTAVDPERARRRIVDVFRRELCDRESVAKVLEIHPASLRRIVLKLDLREKLDEIEEEAKRLDAADADRGVAPSRHHGRLGGRPRHTPTYLRKRARAEREKSRHKLTG
jgi:hypothetical protein